MNDRRKGPWYHLISATAVTTAIPMAASLTSILSELAIRMRVRHVGQTGTRTENRGRNVQEATVHHPIDAATDTAIGKHWRVGLWQGDIGAHWH